MGANRLAEPRIISTRNRLFWIFVRTVVQTRRWGSLAWITSITLLRIATIGSVLWVA